MQFNEHLKIIKSNGEEKCYVDKYVWFKIFEIVKVDPEKVS